MKPIALAALMISCATTPKADEKKVVKTMEPEKQVLKNILAFDVASCFPKKSDIAMSNSELVNGALFAIGPALQECLVSEKSTTMPFDAKLKVVATDTAAPLTIEGAGLSESATACVKTVLQNVKLGAARKGDSFTATVPLSPSPNRVTMGINAASDVVGQIREAGPSMCECYAAFQATNPPAVMLEVETKEKDSNIKLVGSGEATACMEQKLKSLTFAKAGVKFKIPMLLINSHAASAPPTGPAEIVFQALDAQSQQNMSEVMSKAGSRAHAALDYDEVVKKYKGKPTKALLDDLQKKCPMVSGADEAQIAALKGLQNKYAELANFAANEKTKNAQWETAESMVLKKKATITAEISRVEQQKVADMAACPKMK
jgi:hypothetical protein